MIFQTIILLLTNFIYCNKNSNISIEKNHSITFDTLLQNSILSFASYCPVQNIINWNCFWCNLSTIQIEHITTHYYQPLEVLYFTGIDVKSKTLFISFKGTPSPFVSFKDWVKDFDFAMIELEDSPKDVLIHRGWWSFYEVFKNEFKINIPRLLREYENDIEKIRIMGHSLGGTSAAFAAIQILQLNDSYVNKIHKNNELQVFAYGCPRVGNKQFANYFESLIGKENIFRVVHRRDMVAGYPTKDLRSPDFYHHFSHEYYFHDDGKEFKKCDGTGEDPTCSNREIKWSARDHGYYCGHELFDGAFDPYFCW